MIHADLMDRHCLEARIASLEDDLRNSFEDRARQVAQLEAALHDQAAAFEAFRSASDSRCEAKNDRIARLEAKLAELTWNFLGCGDNWDSR